MANYCLLPNQIDNFKQALKDKDLDIKDLFNMDSAKRTEVFKQYAGDNAKAVNTLFEEKLVLKNRILGIQNLFSKLGEFGKNSAENVAMRDKAISEYKAAQQERIFSPQEHQAFLNDLADKRIGTHISQEQAAKVFELSKKVADTKQTTQMSGMSPEYLNARKELNNFVKSVDAPTATKSIIKNAAIIGRNNLLMNPATPLKSFESQFLNSATEAITRRLSTMSGRVNPDLVSQANTEAWNTFKKTGVNTASMESINDTHMLGRGEDFNTPTQPTNRGMNILEKAVSKVAQISNKVVIDWAHNQTFTKFYQKTFFDTANINAARVAKIEGLGQSRAAEIFKDAARVEPQTEQGALVRHMAQEQAARITSSNNTRLSDFSLYTKKALNQITPGLGDFVLPIAKIPATLVANGLDNAGLGVPFGAKDMVKGWRKMQLDDMQSKLEGAAQFANGTQRLIRIGGTLGTAALLTSQLKKDDFRTDNYGNTFVKIGNTWINTEYFSVLSPAISGMMQVKTSKEHGLVNDVGQYVVGGGKSLLRLPGLSEAKDLAVAVTNSDIKKGTEKYVKDFFGSRSVPAFTANLFKGRPINRLFFGASGVESQQQVDQDNKAKADKAAVTRKANALAKKEGN